MVQKQKGVADAVIKAAKAHLQNVAIAAAINIDRLVAWFAGRPRWKTRLSRFAALAPEHAVSPG